MRCEFLGTGTSHGIPVIGCTCHCCSSSDSRDKRFRSSLWITEGDSHAPTTSILIDMGPDFRSQALKSTINRLDALLLTHGHADHLNGLDDIRIFSHTGSKAPPADDGQTKVYPETEGEGLPVYGNSGTLQDVRQRFSYIFQPVMEGGGKPKVKTIDCSAFSEDNPLEIGGLSIIPVPLLHGKLETTGWLILQDYDKNERIENQRAGPCRGIVYLTDCNQVPQSKLAMLRRFGPCLHHVVVDGLRQRPHSTHFSYDEALDVALEIGGRHNWLTHLCHDMTHAQVQGYLDKRLEELAWAKKNIPGREEAPDQRYGEPAGTHNFFCQPAYDGLVLHL